MRKHGRVWSLLLALAVLLCACGGGQQTDGGQGAGQPQGGGQAQGDGQSQDGGQDSGDGQSQGEQHSALYLPGCSVEQMTEYFEEVVLQMEYTEDDASAVRVQKWVTPICYEVYGFPTEEDLQALKSVVQQLNAIEGFPGIYEAEEEWQANVRIGFLDAETFRDSFSEVVHGEDAYGAAQFWFTVEDGALYEARIGIRADIEQAERSSIVPEEIVNILGISDTELREDSITYQYSNGNMELSREDLAILRLLYDPAIRGGMDAAQCREVIGKLYY